MKRFLLMCVIVVAIIGGSLALVLPHTSFGAGVQTTGKGTVYHTGVTPLANEEFATADYLLWLPSNVSALQGVIAWGPWCGGSSLGSGYPTSDTGYIANKYHLAVLSQTLTHKNGTRNCHEAYPDKGSATALFRALKQFATLSHHNELANAPLVTEGMSVTAGWALGIAKLYPGRVIATFARGVPDNDMMVKATKDIPVAISVGDRDGFRNGDIPDFQQYRALNAPWSLTVTYHDGHTWNSSITRSLQDFLDGVLPLRLTDTPGKLRVINPDTQGWLANLTTHQIAAVAQFKGNKLQASWFPDQRCAQDWVKLVTTGKL